MTGGRKVTENIVERFSDTSENEIMIKIDNVKKQYRLGTIGGGTLRGDLQSWWAKVRGKEDPNSKIGAKVYKKNEKFMALDGITLEVKKGERLGIIGHNGAGKSTLLKILSRVTAPTEGTVYLNGRISSMLEVGTGFHPELTGRENIYLNGAILGMTRAEVDSKIDKIIEFSECGQFIDTPVKRYSSGMYVKLAFSVAAHLDSEILVMDEVLAVGDMKFQQKCLDKMNDVSKEDARTILYVSHNMNTIRQLCSRCVVLEKGQIIFDGDVEEAVQVYMNNVPENISSHRELENAVRPNYISGSAKLLSADFEGKENCVFEVGEEIHLFLRWRAERDVDNVCLRLTLCSPDGVPVGSAVSGGLGSAKAGETVESPVSVCFKGLSQCRGYLTFALFRPIDMGMSDVIDEVEEGCPMRFLDGADPSTRLRWPLRKWGFVRFPDITRRDK